MRIIDQPNHPHYGPVRRLWVVFQTILSDKYAYADEEYPFSWGEPWDETLSRWLSFYDEDPKQVPALMRTLVGRMMHIVR